jgi:hypothetical protein
MIKPPRLRRPKSRVLVIEKMDKLFGVIKRRGALAGILENRPVDR